MLRKLILLRHGESADKQIGQSDFDRTLTERGHHSITQLGLFLMSEEIIPDFILSSGAIRTKQTTQAMLEVLSVSSSAIIFDMELYLGFDLHYRDSILKICDHVNSLLVVGHNPSISSLTGIITGQHSKALLPGQAAYIELDLNDEKIKRLKGRLVKFIGPFVL